MKILRVILFLPGYIVLGIRYIFPSEWGTDRDVTRTKRQWDFRHIMAPIISIPIYVLVYYGMKIFG